MNTGHIMWSLYANFKEDFYTQEKLNTNISQV